MIWLPVCLPIAFQRMQTLWPIAFMQTILTGRGKGGRAIYVFSYYISFLLILLLRVNPPYSP